jgi:hypothetical protein
MEDRGDVAQIEVTFVVRERLAEGVLNAGITNPSIVFTLSFLGSGSGMIQSRIIGFFDTNPKLRSGDRR